jgi:hypothetical protein
MSAIVILIFIGLIVWGAYKRRRFFAKGSHPTYQEKPPDLANFAPPAPPKDPAPTDLPDEPADPLKGQP